jgi:GNAT superfamily N-acetyltransferase
LREPRRPILEVTPELGVEWRPAWRLRDAAIEADAKALWRRLALLPDGIDPDLRADELVCAAYVDGDLVAAATAFVREIEFLRARFAMLRVSVAPDYRRHAVSRRMSGLAREVLEKWSFDHPEAEVMGMATVVQNADIAAKPRGAIWRSSGLVLVGYTDAGEQVRVAWFDHARV